MKRLTILIMMTIFYLIVITPSYATSIFYDLTNVNGNTWKYNYTITNDSLIDDIVELSIFFEYGLYENISAAGSPFNWGADAYDPELILGIPDDGAFNAWDENMDAAISPGASLSGFSVSFDWLGGANETPGSQYFEIYAHDDWDPIDFGDTQLAGSSSIPVPEPFSLVLLGSGICGLLVSKRKRLTN